jgi:zinc transport system substrate-binding protein
MLLSIHASCSRSSNLRADKQDKYKTPRVFAVNYPLAYFAERIGGKHVEVHFPAPRDVDPAFWQPDAETVVEYQTADLILLNGADYAKWIKRASLPLSRVVNTTLGISDQYIRIENDVTHQHGPSGEHTHAGNAFTTWLDFRIAIEQARAVYDALVKLMPNQRTELEANLSALVKDLKALDAAIERIVSQGRGQPLFVSHPVYQYLTRRYGLNVKSVDWEPNMMPDEESWAEFEKLLAAHPAKWMIWEGAPNEKVVNRLANFGITSVVFAPAGNTPVEGDFLSVMRGDVEQLKRVFE